MTNLKIAVQATDVEGLRRRSEDSYVAVHAYDVENPDNPFPYHLFEDGDEIVYDVKPDVDWSSKLLPGPRCEICMSGEQRRA